jgi:hypothetical protein
MQQRSRLGALFSTPFLWLIGVATFLPTVKACERVESPASLIRGGPLPFSLLLSPFVVAELLAVIILLAGLLRAEPSRRWWLATLALVVPAFSSPATLVYCFCDKPTHLTDQLYILGSALASLAALVILIRGVRADGWGRILASVRAFTVLSLPLAVWFVHLELEEHLRHVYAGGPLFVGGMIGLVAVAARFRPSRAITRA